MKLLPLPILSIVITGICIPSPVYAQQVTGVWKGRIDKKKVEVKIIQQGDSLTGTSYYYENQNSYRRYSIRGYFDPRNNSVVWWDDQLLEEKHNAISTTGKQPLLSVADFNCPGAGEMYLTGKASLKAGGENVKGPIALQKTEGTQFPDDWDFIIDNYMLGGNDPYLIDSIGALVRNKKQQPDKNLPADRKKDMAFIPAPAEKALATDKQVPVETPPSIVVTKPMRIEDKLMTRQRILVKEIELAGDSIELRFYDNAEVDGDSITLFLNDRMIFEHIRLTEKAFVIKLPVTDLVVHNELVMVAENLGSIPPNTSYMVCIAGDKRYEANLTSTEGSSAMIRFVRSE